MLYEPDCRADGPSTWRSAACTTWVPECAWHAESRHSGSTSASTAAPARSGPVTTSTVCATRPLTGRWTSSTFRSHAVGGDDALVGDLAAGLRVERRAVEHDLAALAGLDLGRRGSPSTTRPSDVRLAGELLVGAEVGLAERPQVAPHLGVRVAGLLRLRVGLGPLALLLHQAGEALAVDLEALLLRHLQGQVDREAVGVVQLERLVARRASAPPDSLVRATAVSRMVVPAARVRRNASSSAYAIWLIRPKPALQLGVGLLHPLQGDRQQLGQARVVEAEQAHRAHRAAQHPAQHVAAALVAGGDAVADEHQRGAHVVGDDPQPHVVGVRLADHVAGVDAVALAGELGRPLEHGVDLVDLVEVVDALEQGRHPLQAHAGVDVALGQRAGDVEVVLGADRRELLLHEHEVPELEVAVLVDGRAALAAVLRARGRGRSRCTGRRGRGRPCASSCRACRGG